MTKTKLTNKQRHLIVIAFFGTFVCFFNQTTINPALPTIIRDFSISASTAQWLLSGYLMIMAIMIPINAYLLERYSVKKIIIFAMSIYFVGCIFTGLGLNFIMTLIGRLFQGAGHGILMPTCMAAMLYIFPMDRRGSVLGLYGLLVGFAPILGPTYSGVVVDNLSWHFVYYSIALFSLIVLICSIIFLPSMNITEVSNKKLDYLSLATSTLGFGFLLFGCSEVGAVGFSPVAIISMCLGGIIVAYFFYRQTKIDNPMLEVSVFKSKNFTISIIVLMIVQLAFMGAIVLFAFLIQDVLGYSPTVSGMVLIPSSIVMGVMSLVTGRLFDKYGIKFLSIAGLSLMTIAGICLSTLNDHSPLYLLICFLCIRNFGASCVLMNINT